MTTAGIKGLTKVQLGRESTAGTAVAATTVWGGPAPMIDDARTNVMPEENIGFSSKVTRQYTPLYMAKLSFPTTEATFEQLPHVLEAGVKAATATQDGAGTDYIRVYTIPSGDSNTIKTYTIETGDNKDAREMEYSFVEKFTLEGKKGESWMVSSDWVGRQSSTSTFTSALSRPTVAEMLFQKTKLYFDAVGGTIGTTQVVNSLLAAKIEVTTGWKAQPTADGNLYFSYSEFIGAQIKINMTLLNNTTTIAERVFADANTPRLIRFLVQGLAVGTPGTTYSVKTALLDFAGIYTKFNSPSGEDEGSNVYEVEFEGAYNATAAKFGEITIVNELSALP